ncbi:hypothetical protein ACHAWX_004144, partial [Stephanocyclus meneghinianus]
ANKTSASTIIGINLISFAKSKINVISHTLFLSGFVPTEYNFCTSFGGKCPATSYEHQ